MTVVLTQEQIDYNSNIHIPHDKWDLFPGKSKYIELQYERNVIKRKFNHRYHEFAMGKWFTAYKLQGGDKVIITPLEEKNKYSIIFLREK